MSRRARRLDWLLAKIAGLALRTLTATWRVLREGEDPLLSGRQSVAIGATWHRNLLIALGLFRDRSFSVSVSRSRDGDRIAALLGRMGFTAPSRGSSSRGGAAALRGLVREVQAGTTVTVPVDGPRGPARRSKIGVVTLSRLTGVPITPVSFSARPCLRFGSWDGTLLPFPFARVVCRFADPIGVDAEKKPQDAAGCDALEREAQELLDRRLNRDTDELDTRLGLKEAR
jgi:lysophospholipid acyltransferase (LPLAT)-like uncharacterized protein